MNFRPPWKHQEEQNSNWMRQGNFRNNNFQRRPGMGPNDSRDHDRRNNPWAMGVRPNSMPKPPEVNRIPSLLDLPPATGIWEQPPPVVFEANIPHKQNRPYNAPEPLIAPMPVPPPTAAAPMLAPPPPMPLSLLLQSEIWDMNNGKGRGDARPNPSVSAIKTTSSVQQVEANVRQERQEMGATESRKQEEGEKKPGTDDLLDSLNKYHEEFQLSKYANPPRPEDASAAENAAPQIATSNAAAASQVSTPNVVATQNTAAAAPNATTPRESNNSESVTQKLLNRLTLMDKHNIKQVINHPEPKYESALKKRANQLIRANVRQKLRHFSIEESAEAEGEQRMIEPDVFVDSDKVPEVVFNEIKNVLGLEAPGESLENSIEQDSMFMEFDNAIEATIPLETFSGAPNQEIIPTEDFSVEEQTIKENVTLNRVNRESTEMLGDANTLDSVMNEAVDTDALSPLMAQNEEDHNIRAFADNGIAILSANDEFTEDKKSQTNLNTVPSNNINEPPLGKEMQQNYRMPHNRRPSERFTNRHDDRYPSAGRRHYDADRSRRNDNYTRDSSRDSWDSSRSRDDRHSRERDRGRRTPERNLSRSSERDRRPPEGEKRFSEAERKPPESDRRPPGIDRRSPEADRRPLGVDRRSPEADRRPLGMDRRSPEVDRKSPEGERRVADLDRRPPETYRRPPDSDRRPPRGRPQFSRNTLDENRKRSNADQDDSSALKKKRFERRDRGDGQQRVWLSPGEKKCLPQTPNQERSDPLFGPKYKSKYVQTMYQPTSPTKSLAERELKIFHEMKQIDTNLMEMQRKKIEIDQQIQRLQTELMSIEMQSMKLQNTRFDLLNRILTIPVGHEDCLMESDFEVSPMRNRGTSNDQQQQQEGQKKTSAPNPEALKTFKIPKLANTVPHVSQARLETPEMKKKKKPPPKPRKPTNTVHFGTNIVENQVKETPPKIEQPVAKVEPPPPKAEPSKSEISKVHHPPAPKKDKVREKEKEREKDREKTKVKERDKERHGMKEKKSSKGIKIKIGPEMGIKKKSTAPVAKIHEEPPKAATPDPTDWSKILKDCSVSVERYTREMIDEVLGRYSSAKAVKAKDKEDGTKDEAKPPSKTPKIVQVETPCSSSGGSKTPKETPCPSSGGSKTQKETPDVEKEKPVVNPKENILTTEWKNSLESTTKASVNCMEVAKGCIFVSVKDDVSLYRFSWATTEGGSKCLELHSKPISSLVCYESEYIFTISADGFVRKVSCEEFTGSSDEFDCGGALEIISKAPWGKLYVVKEGKKIIAFDVKNLKDNKELNCETGSKIIGVVASEVDGQKVISVASQANEFSFRNAESGELIKRFHLEWTIDFFTGHNRMLHCGIDGKDLIHYKIMTGEEIARCNIGQKVIHVKNFADMLFILSKNGAIYVWNCVENQFIGVIKGPEGDISGFSVENKKIFIITSQNVFWSCDLPGRLLTAPSPCKSNPESTDNSKNNSK